MAKRSRVPDSSSCFLWSGFLVSAWRWGSDRTSDTSPVLFRPLSYQKSHLELATEVKLRWCSPKSIQLTCYFLSISQYRNKFLNLRLHIVPFSFQMECPFRSYNTELYPNLIKWEIFCWLPYYIPGQQKYIYKWEVICICMAGSSAVFLLDWVFITIIINHSVLNLL